MPRLSIRFVFCCLPLIALPLFTVDATAQKAESTISPIQNGDFSKWDDGIPTAWNVGIGAQNGTGAESKVEAIADGGLKLVGATSTKVWRSVAQSIPVKSGSSVSLRFSARADGVRREGQQYDNCFVGLFFFDANRKGLGAQVEPVVWKEWTDRTLTATVPANATECDVTIFLSKTGTLQVRSVAIAGGDEVESFDQLLDELENKYSFAKLKAVDWETLKDRYGPAARGANSPHAFVKAIQLMLATLEDMHVWIVDPNGKRTHCHSSGYKSNVNFGAVRKQLSSEKTVGKVAMIGRTKDNVGYVAISTLTGNDQLFAEVKKEVSLLFDCRAIIIDLRKNSGGNEGYAQTIAGLFAVEPLEYARSVYRNGPRSDDFSEAAKRWLRPATKEPFTGPVACLIGPGCVSSGEGFALMMAAVPNAKLFGQPTRGASGNPAPVLLSNRVQVFFSRWICQTPDGTPIEGQGVQPDERVEHRGGDLDTTFLRAIEYLNGELAPK